MSSVTPQELAQIIEEFKNYFGLMDRNNLVAFAVGSSASKLDPTFEAQEGSLSSDVDKIIDILTPTLGYGYLMSDGDNIIQEGDSSVKKTEMGMLNRLSSFWSGLTREDVPSELGQKFLDGSVVKLLCNKQGTVNNFKNIQQIFYRSLETEKEISFIDVLGKKITNRDKYNLKGSPSKENPSIAIIDCLRPELSRPNHDASIAALWAGGMPSMELAKCVPYLDVKLYDPRLEAVNETNKKLGYNPSAMKFILGGKKTLNENEARFARATLSEPVSPNSALDPAELANVPSVAGMELFTMPQTYQGKREQYVDLNPEGYSGDRPNSVIDPFRPFMVVNSFDVNVESTNTVMSVMRGTLNLTLGDRTRLHEVASLIRPDKLTSLELIIEWGWSHPSNDTTYGKLLNASRQKRKFLVATSSYTFNTDGTVGITLNLYAKGAERVTKGLMSAVGAPEIDTIARLIKDLRARIERINSMSGVESSKSLFGEGTVGLLTSVDNVLSLSSEAKKEIEKRFNKEKNKDLDVKTIQNILFRKKKGATGEEAGLFENINNYRTSLDDAYKQLDEAVRDKSEDNDPWSQAWDDENIRKYAKLNKRTYISFARIVSIYIATCLAEQGMFDDVQMYFYGFNDCSYGLHRFQISQFPIDREEFITLFSQWRDTKRNPSILQFLGWLMQTFITERKDNPAWGLSGAYRKKTHKDKNGNTRYTVERRRYKASHKEKKPLKVDEQSSTFKAPEKTRAYSESAFRNKLVAAQKKIYGDAANKKLRNPKLRVDVETVGSIESEKRSILRLHIYDAAQDLYRAYTDVIKASQNTSSGYISNVSDDYKAEVKKGKSPLAAGVVINQKINKSLELMKNAGIVKLIDQSDRLQTDGGVEEWENGYIKKTKMYKIDAKPGKIKYFIASNMPTLKYGTEATIIKSAAISSNSDAQYAMIQLKRRMNGDVGKIPAGLESGEFPMQIFPVSLGLEIIGCPYFKHGQQFFFDFQTNTDIDNAYIVTGINHKISSNDYSTSVKLTQVDKFGYFQHVSHKLTELDAQLQELMKAEIDEAERQKRLAKQKTNRNTAKEADPPSSKRKYTQADLDAQIEIIRKYGSGPDNHNQHKWNEIAKELGHISEADFQALGGGPNPADLARSADIARVSGV